MINYRGTPLFGEGSSVSHTSEFFAISGTVLFWLIFMIFAFVIKPQPEKPKYKEVQIVLSSTPVVQKTEESPAPAEAAAASEPAFAKSVETPVPEATSAPVQKTVEAPKTDVQTKQQPKQTTRKETASTQQKTEPVLYKSVDDQIAEQFKTKSLSDKMKDFDSMFADESDDMQEDNQVKTVQNTEPVMYGSAGELTGKNVEVIKSQSSDNIQNQTASAETSRSLKKVTDAKFKSNGFLTNQMVSAPKADTSGVGKSEINWSNGSSRALIKPASNDIYLSKEAQATIDVSKTVSISFKVLAGGNVTEIKITPESILSAIVRNEIKTQIAQWLFETADYTAVATFECNIIKR